MHKVRISTGRRKVRNNHDPYKMSTRINNATSNEDWKEVKSIIRTIQKNDLGLAEELLTGSYARSLPTDEYDAAINLINRYTI